MKNNRKSSEEQKEAMLRVKALLGQGKTLKDACAEEKMHPSMYYRYTRKFLKASPNPTTKRAYVRKTPAPINTLLKEESIPVILTRLTPTQLAAFMNN